jgi:hypothetical protein
MSLQSPKIAGAHVRWTVLWANAEGSDWAAPARDCWKSTTARSCAKGPGRTARPINVTTLADLWERAAVGPIPGVLVVVAGVLFHGGWAVFALITYRMAEESAFIPDITAQAASRARCTSICAAAMTVARANAMGSASGPASASANSLTCWWNAGSAIAGTPKPRRRALREERALPSGVFGPLLLLPFLRLVSR